jgi:tetratricopeptide (TPR) repeat protein
LDSSLAEAWAARGYITLFASGPPTDAERDLLRAIRLRPSYAEAHGWLAQVYAYPDQGREGEAMAPITRSVELDPGNVGLRMGYSGVAFGARDFALAYETTRALRVLRPDFRYSVLFEGISLAKLGRWQECLRIPGVLKGTEALCLYAGGRNSQAASLVATMVEDWERGVADIYQMVNLIYYFGQAGQVVELKQWLSRAYERSPVWAGLSFGGMLDPAIGVEGSDVRAYLEGLRQTAWARVLRESRAVALP